MKDRPSACWLCYGVPSEPSICRSSRSFTSTSALASFLLSRECPMLGTPAPKLKIGFHIANRFGIYSRFAFVALDKHVCALTFARVRVERTIRPHNKPPRTFAACSESWRTIQFPDQKNCRLGVFDGMPGTGTSNRKSRKSTFRRSA